MLLGPGPLLSSGGFPESGTWLPWHLLFRFLFYFSFLLTYNSYAIKPSILKCGNEWFFVFSQCCTTTLPNSRTFSSPQKEVLYPLAVTPQPPLPSASGKHRSTFCLCGFAYSGYFISLRSYNMWPLGAGFFHSASRFEGSLCCSRCRCFLPFYGQIISTV